MKNICLFILLSFSLTATAQPDFLGTMVVNGNYTTSNLTDLGAFRQVRLQATNSAAVNTRIWEFATGNYFENWRPYTFPTTASVNQVINPALDPASARFNSGFGGASSYLPAITSGNYYTFNITEYAPPTDQFMAILETSFEPVTINTVMANPSGDPMENMPVSITITTSATPVAGEHVYIRYSTDNFTSSSLVELSFSGTTGTAQIPGLPGGTTVSYYIYSSNFDMASILNEVTTNGEVSHDMVTLNLNNNGTNYSYIVQVTLPIELIGFEAFSKDKYIELYWETASELNNSHFEIEKSADANLWSTIGRVDGVGITSQTQQYHFQDSAPFDGDNYYRLKQVDFDGNYSYSPKRSVWRETKAEVSLFPNPAKDQIFLKNVKPKEQWQIQIFDINGRLVLAENWNGNSVKIAQLEQGIYFVKLIHKNKIHQQRIFVQ